MTTAQRHETAPDDGVVPQRDRAEALELIVAALQPISAEMQSQLQLRRLDDASNQHRGIGWEAYINDPPNGACWVCFLVDTIEDDTPFPRVNQRFMSVA
jgi:hypothetical protein